MENFKREAACDARLGANAMDCSVKGCEFASGDIKKSYWKYAEIIGKLMSIKLD